MIEMRIIDELKIYLESYASYGETAFLKKSSPKIMKARFLKVESFSPPIMESESLDDMAISEGIDQYIKNNKAPAFQKMLFSHIDRLGLKDSDVYNKAQIDRRLFSKIRSSHNYRPSKLTVIALGLALELSTEAFEELLRSAGHSLSYSDTTDLIIRFCLEREIWDLFKVNELLDYFGEKTL